VQYSQIFSIACLTLGLSAVSCASSDPAPAAGCTSFDYAKYTAGTVQRTAADVLAITNADATCGTTACHANPANPPALASSGAMMVTADSIKAAMVNVTSKEVALMKYVVPGDPEHSYLMRKLDDPNPGCGLTCVPPSTIYPAACSTRMPQGTVDGLPEAQRSVIRDWILQGAK
jgi:hypothetical protein